MATTPEQKKVKVIEPKELLEMQIRWAEYDVEVAKSELKEARTKLVEWHKERAALEREP